MKKKLPNGCRGKWGKGKGRIDFAAKFRTLRQQYQDNTFSVNSCIYFLLPDLTYDMKANLKDEIILIHHEDLPTYKKGGSVVRNSYFWALKSIACYAPRNSDWEFDKEVWVALARMLLAFSESGYLGYAETCLEFPQETNIPDTLRTIGTWL